MIPPVAIGADFLLRWAGSGIHGDMKLSFIHREGAFLCVGLLGCGREVMWVGSICFSAIFNGLFLFLNFIRCCNLSPEILGLNEVILL